MPGPSLPLPAACPSRGKQEGQTDHPSPGSGLRRPPGERRETGERTGLGERVPAWDSVAAAATVPARMGVLAVPKLGPPAQDLIGAVLPTAAGHAWGRVIDFKSAGRQEERVGGGRRMPSTPGVRAQEQGRGPGRRRAHTISPSPSPLDLRPRSSVSGQGGPGQGKRHEPAAAAAPGVPHRAQLLTAVLL